MPVVRCEEVAASLAIQNMERDAPWTAWSKMLQLREDVGVSFAGRNVEQNVPRTDWDCNSQPHEEDVFSSSVSFRRKGRLGGGKWLCVVVKCLQDDAFVVTAYLTDKPKAGENLWPIS
jgi:hypothetical protein